MRPVLGLHETVVSGAADGYARMARKPACTVLHLGPGLANAPREPAQRAPRQLPGREPRRGHGHLAPRSRRVTRDGYRGARVHRQLLGPHLRRPGRDARGRHRRDQGDEAAREQRAGDVQGPRGDRHRPARPRLGKAKRAGWNLRGSERGHVRAGSHRRGGAQADGRGQGSRVPRAVRRRGRRVRARDVRVLRRGRRHPRRRRSAGGSRQSRRGDGRRRRLRERVRPRGPWRIPPAPHTAPLLPQGRGEKARVVRRRRDVRREKTDRHVRLRRRTHTPSQAERRFRLGD